MTRSSASRTEHPSFDKNGGCTRCGLPNRAGKHCPPGFWMTRAEQREWDALGDRQRDALEKRLIAKEQRA